MSVASSSGGRAARTQHLGWRPQHCLVHRISRSSRRLQLIRQIVVANDDHLLRRRQQPFEREPVRTGIEAEMLHDARECLQRIFGHVSRSFASPFSASRRSSAAAAVGFPAGVGVSCSGLRRAESAPIAPGSAAVSKNPPPVAS